jgi:hypothetical protein
VLSWSSISWAVIVGPPASGACGYLADTGADAIVPQAFKLPNIT